MPPLVTLVPMLFVIAGSAGYACARRRSHVDRQRHAPAVAGGRSAASTAPGPAPPVERGARGRPPLPVVLRGRPGGPAGSVNHLDGTPGRADLRRRAGPVLTPTTAGPAQQHRASRRPSAWSASGRRPTRARRPDRRRGAHAVQPQLVAPDGPGQAVGGRHPRRTARHQPRDPGRGARARRSSTSGRPAATSPTASSPSPGRSACCRCYWTFDTQDWDYATFAARADHVEPHRRRARAGRPARVDHPVPRLPDSRTRSPRTSGCCLASRAAMRARGAADLTWFAAAAGRGGMWFGDRLRGHVCFAGLRRGRMGATAIRRPVR